ncbi:tetratricopeptide repeat protein [Streptomyces sp. B21-105]|uniref:tetratricopeptide repeat protein n=1 Tax=Streptomyces sp. B21-105 TaxID=3039417 RepID=UPI002FF336B4
MSRLSREKKREQKHPGRPAGVVAPLDVHVRAGGAGGAGGAATIGGVPVAAVEGEEIQRAVLGHLHRIALATGHSVLATVHDERIGYVVPLRVDPDGSSHFTAEPLRTPAAPAPAVAPPVTSAVVEDGRPLAPGPGRDSATHLLRPVSEPVRDTSPTFPMRTVPEREPETERHAEAGRTQGSDPSPTYALRAVPESSPEPEGAMASEPESEEALGDVQAPGTVAAPTGVFGPPPTMDERPNPETATPQAPTAPPSQAPTAPPPQAPTSVLNPPSAPIPLPLPVSAVPTTLTSTPSPTPLVPEELISVAGLDPDPKPTPARGFDAVAEAVLGDDPRTLQGPDGAPALLAEPMARINEAVRAGRTDVAAGLAERTVLEASGTLGPEHPEVLRLRELTAYIAYLAGDPLRAFHISLELARLHRRAGGAEGAYGNVQSAAAAWRAVRDPFQGLNLGTELLGLWTELAAEEGPAADDVEELESARARMLRLAARARRSGG